MRLIRSWNVGNVCVAAGFAVLGFTLWMPYGTASRVARIESRAEATGRAVLQAVDGMAPESLADPAQRDALIAALVAKLPGLGRLEAAREGPVVLHDRHYCYAVLVAEGEASSRPGEEATAVVEAYAWPNSSFNDGRTAFYFPRGGRAAYTRNLHARYSGPEITPLPGDGLPRESQRPVGVWYLGRNEERWIYLPR